MAKQTFRHDLRANNGVPEWEQIQDLLNRPGLAADLDWELNLSHLPRLDSLGLGNLIMLNGALLQRDIRLTVTVRKNSQPARLLLASEISRVIPVEFV